MRIFRRQNQQDAAATPSAGQSAAAVEHAGHAEAWVAHMRELDQAGELGALDFSMESLETLDEIVGAFSEHGSPLPRTDEDGMAAYLFECLRRNHGGDYAQGPSEQDPIALVYAGDGWLVTALCQHRIGDRLREGPSASIPFFAAGYPQHIAERRSATLV